MHGLLVQKKVPVKTTDRKKSSEVNYEFEKPIQKFMCGGRVPCKSIKINKNLKAIESLIFINKS